MARKADEEIVNWLKQHTFYESGYDITKGPFPLPATIGEGFKFQSLDFLIKMWLTMLQKLTVKIISECCVLIFQLLSDYVEELVTISVGHIQIFIT